MRTVREAVTVTGEGLTLDLILWRKFRQPMNGVIEKVLDANQGLAKLGMWLPVGTKVVIPVIDTEERSNPDVIVLWS